MKKIITSLTKFFRTFRYGDTIRPVRDWLVLLGAVLVGLALSFLWNIWLFAQVTGGDAIGTATTTPALTTTSIEPVQTFYQKRATEQTRYKSEYRFVDPSL